MLWAHDQDGIREQGKVFVVPQRRHGPAQGKSQLLGRAARMIINLKRRVTAKERDRALLRAKSFLDMQRLPRTLFFILTYTESELRRVPHCRLADLLGYGSANVEQD